MTKFEERLWSLIRSFVELGHNNPAMLVAAVRIVEIQEMVDKQLESSGGGTHHSLIMICLDFLKSLLLHAEYESTLASSSVT